MRSTSFLLFAVLATVAFGQDVDLGNIDFCAAVSFVIGEGTTLRTHSFYIDNRITTQINSLVLFSDACQVTSNEWHFLTTTDDNGNPFPGRLDFYPKVALEDPPLPPIPPFTPPTSAVLAGVIGFTGEGLPAESPQFQLTATFTGFTGVPGASPDPPNPTPDTMTAPKTAAPNANPSVWDFFDTVDIVLTGVDGTSVAGIILTGERKGPMAQYGPQGGNDKTDTLGLSSWIQFTELEQPYAPTTEELEPQNWPAGRTDVCQVNTKAGVFDNQGRTIDINVDLQCKPGTPGTDAFGDPWDIRCDGHPSN